MHRLTIGTRYFIKTTSGSRFRGVYLGPDIYGRHQFDLRPEYGTTTVAREDIVLAEPTIKPGP